MNKLLIALLLLVAKNSFAQDCQTLAANKPSTLVSAKDEISSSTGKISSIEMAKIKPHLTKAENWVKKLLANFTGAKLLYYNTYFPDYFKDGSTYKSLTEATGIKSYYNSTMMFFAYYCYDNSNTIHTEAESGSTIYVKFNDVFAFGFSENSGIYTINGKPAFKTIQKKRSEGRIDFYEQRSQDNATAKMFTANEYIILRNSDKPVFIPVTRKEYLEQMLKDAQASGISDTKKMTEIYAQNEKQFEAEMKAYKLDKNYTPEKEAKRRKWFEEDQEKLKKANSKTTPGTEAYKELILQYLKKPAEWLNKGFNSFYSYSTYTVEGVKQFVEGWDKSHVDREGETPGEIVSFNPAYFDKTLSSDVPQLIMVHLRNGTYPHMKKVADLVHKPGALKPLQNILTPGKQPAEQSLVVSTSTYKLSYLPKLDKLTPLTVPADMKPSIVSQMPVNYPPVVKLNFAPPLLSPKLKQLPVQPFTSEAYKNYLVELHSKISAAIKPETKKKADDYLANKKLTQSKDISNAAFGAWLQNTPDASLYLYSNAVVNDPTDALAANNFSAFLMMGGLPEKSIPILEFWNKQKSGESTLLANLGNAYYRLGDINSAMKYLQQCIQKDSLHPTANKLLCMMYLKKGDAKKAEEHGTRSITACHDEEIISILHQLNNKIKMGEVMSRFPPLPLKEFPMLKRIQLPVMPSNLDDMEQFTIVLNAIKESLNMTIADIDAKHPKASDDIQQQILMAGFKNGISPIRIKAQYIIMDGMQIYHAEKVKEADVFNYNLKKLNVPHNAKMKAILKKYGDQLNKLEGGEAGDEDKIQALELAQCKELNAEKQAYLTHLSELINQHTQRKEFISRKFFRDYANWAPYWMPQTSISFPSIERDYLKDVMSILSDYTLISKSGCSVYEPLPEKQGSLQEWEDEYCANFKGKIAMGPVKVFFTCNSWGVDGGEGFVGDVEFKYRNNGVFENFTLGAGVGANWHLGKEGVIKTEAGILFKDFIKIGPDEATGKWVVKDVGVKAEIAGEAGIGKVSVEEKVIEVSLAVNAGLETGGIVPSVFNLK